MVPDGWQTSFLGEILDLSSGKRPALEDRAPVPVYGGNGLMGWAEQPLVREPVVVIGRVGSPGTIHVTDGPAWISDNALYVRDFSETVALAFLPWLLDFERLDRYATRSSHPSLSQRVISQVEVVLPPLPEQREISAILSSVNDAITATRKVIEQTKRVKLGLLQTLITRGIGHTRFKETEIGLVPEAWEVVSLGSIISSLNAGVSVRSESRPAGPDEIGVLKTGSVSDGQFVPNEQKRVLLGDAARVRESPKAGRIIISRMNTRELVGETGLVTKDYPNLFLPDRLWQTEFYPDADMDPEWLAFALCSPSIRERLRALGTGTSGSMKNIAQGKLLRLQIPKPSLGEQKEIASLVRSVSRVEAAQLHLDRLKRGLMQDLLTGRVRVQPG